MADDSGLNRKRNEKRNLLTMLESAEKGHLLPGKERYAVTTATEEGQHERNVRTGRASAL